jgi:transcriptional regulator GlxA family with amidase domain
VSFQAAASPPTQPAANSSLAVLWRERAMRVNFDAKALAHLPEVAVSMRTLQRRFHNEIGLPLDVALLQWRAEAARDFIIATGATTKETAIRFRFHDSAHLDHVFQRFLQRNPQSFSPRKNGSNLGRAAVSSPRRD